MWGENPSGLQHPLRVLELINNVSISTSIPLLTLGVVGLYARYAPAGGKFARVSLAVSVLGGLLASIAILPLLLTEMDSLWLVTVLGFAALFVGLTLFGLAAVRGRLMRRGNWLPAVGGLFFSAFFLASTIYEINTGNWLETSQWVEITGIVVTGLGLVGTGYVMLSDLPEEQVLSPA
jgi:hypothetical protein